MPICLLRQGRSLFFSLLPLQLRSGKSEEMRRRVAHMALEDEFGGTISEEQLEAITSFKDVVDYIVSMHQGNPAK